MAIIAVPTAGITLVILKSSKNEKNRGPASHYRKEHSGDCQDAREGQENGLRLGSLGNVCVC